LKKKKFTVDADSITKCLPVAPEWGHYQIDRFSPLVWRVWLVHDRFYAYASEQVKTIHCFIKSSGDVMRPKNCDKISTERVCHLANIPQSMNLTVMTPRYTTLLSLFD
jgi:hypothetical protein